MMTTEERATSPGPDVEESGPPPDTAELIRWCIGVLAGAAWQNLGLVPNPATKQVERNLNDARLAIDTVAVLVEQVRPRIDDRTRRDLDALLANLRLNFVEQQSRAQSQAPHGA